MPPAPTSDTARSTSRDHTRGACHETARLRLASRDGHVPHLDPDAAVVSVGLELDGHVDPAPVLAIVCLEAEADGVPIVQVAAKALKMVHDLPNTEGGSDEDDEGMSVWEEADTAEGRK